MKTLYFKDMKSVLKHLRQLKDIQYYHVSGRDNVRGKAKVIVYSQDSSKEDVISHTFIVSEKEYNNAPQFFKGH